MLSKIISGGQSGADQAGLFTAQKLGLETGGSMPKGFKTLSGPRPDLAEKYNLVEHSSSLYPPRTYLNVKESDATVRFFTVKYSPGETCTLKAINQYNKIYFDVDFNETPDTQELVKFLSENNIKVLNVAGNSEQTSPGIFQKTAIYLYKAIKQYKEKNA